MTDIENPRPPLPPFTRETALQKVRAAEDAWNSRDPARVALAYTADSEWRNRDLFITGRLAIAAFLAAKWAREEDYRLVKDLWAFTANRIAVRFQYECRIAGHWHRCYGNELWEFAENGLMRRREASINNLAIAEADRRFLWDASSPRPLDHPGIPGSGRLSAMHIAALSGSLRAASINTALLRDIARQAPDRGDGGARCRLAACRYSIPISRRNCRASVAAFSRGNRRCGWTDHRQPRICARRQRRAQERTRLAGWRRTLRRQAGARAERRAAGAPRHRRAARDALYHGSPADRRHSARDLQTKVFPMNKVLTPIVLALLCVSAAAPAAAHETAIAAPAPSHFSVEVVGKGPDVILIPGLSTPREVWLATADALKDRYRVHLVQVRGFGEPAGANAEGSVLSPLVTELSAYIQQQHLDHPAIIGHSLGGLAALKLAADFPDLPGRVMIVDALPFYGVLVAPPGVTVTAETIEPGAKALRDQLAATYGKPAVPGAAEATAASQALDAAARSRIAGWLAAADARVTAQLFYDDLTTDLRPQIASISVPVTVAFPWDGTNTTRAQAETLYQGQYEALPKANFVPIGPSGHFVMLDSPDATQEAVEAFLHG